MTVEKSMDKRSDKIVDSGKANKGRKSDKLPINPTNTGKSPRDRRDNHDTDPRETVPSDRIGEKI